MLISKDVCITHVYIKTTVLLQTYYIINFKKLPGTFFALQTIRQSFTNR